MPARNTATSPATICPAQTSPATDYESLLEFLRIALGTLAESKTTIAELYAWEFDGPFLRDFTGRKATTSRAAGALDATP